MFARDCLGNRFVEDDGWQMEDRRSLSTCVYSYPIDPAHSRINMEVGGGGGLKRQDSEEQSNDTGEESSRIKLGQTSKQPTLCLNVIFINVNKFSTVLHNEAFGRMLLILYNIPLTICSPFVDF